MLLHSLDDEELNSNSRQKNPWVIAGERMKTGQVGQRIGRQDLQPIEQFLRIRPHTNDTAAVDAYYFRHWLNFYVRMRLPCGFCR
jgi:hypothetical protein